MLARPDAVCTQREETDEGLDASIRARDTVEGTQGMGAAMMQIQSIPAVRSSGVLGVARRRGLVERPLETEVAALYEGLSRAFRDLDPEGAAALLSVDAVFVHDESDEIHGREAIRRWLARRLRGTRERGVDLGLSFLVVERGVQNGVVFDVGTFALTGRGRMDVSRVPLRSGRFLAVSRRDREGRTHIVRFSTALPRA